MIKLPLSIDNILKGEKDSNYYLDNIVIRSKL